MKAVQLCVFIVGLLAGFGAQAQFYGGYGESQQPRTERAESAEVLHVAPSERHAERAGYGGAATGAAIGGALGAVAGRNSSRGQVVAGLLGAAIGGHIGNKVSQRPKRGWDVLVRFPGGQVVSLFLKNHPGVAAGDHVYVVGDNRLVRAPAPQEQRRAP